MQFLALDLVGCKRMPDRYLARSILGMLCGRLDMHPLGQPQVEYVAGDRGGFSGSLIIDESHIAFHAYENYGLVYLDIFSCKAFGLKEVISLMQENFLPEEIKVHQIHREPLPVRPKDVCKD